MVMRMLQRCSTGKMIGALFQGPSRWCGLLCGISTLGELMSSLSPLSFVQRCSEFHSAFFRAHHVLFVSRLIVVTLKRLIAKVPCKKCRSSIPFCATVVSRWIDLLNSRSMCDVLQSTPPSCTRSLALGASIFMALLGIAVGHLYYFLVDVLPDLHDIDLFTTPQLFVNMLGWGREGSGVTMQRGAPGAAGMPAPGNVPPPGGIPRTGGGGAGWGSGRTLGSS